ncbi:50S ribosome-binding GTPase [Carex littledalei]|uniref:50S ribosome-binding GTPase n=1 Tax=Carex littledalei TaxID=544730 RepID=A0A833VK71_9POAL|nr:50S ribosome-binding GTPase [Carex littledalei]
MKVDTMVSFSSLLARHWRGRRHLSFSPAFLRRFSSAPPSDTSPPPCLCPGCGVHMQSDSPTLPGYFTLPSSSTSLPNSFPFLSSTFKSGNLSTQSLQPEREPEPEVESEIKVKKPVVCARCHSLRHYGRVKNPSADRLLPEFDFQASVAPRLASPCGAPSLLLLLADASDFDGSFPRGLARLISASHDSHAESWKQGKPSNLPRPLLVVSRADLLPRLPPGHLEEWARSRARDGGLTAPLAGIQITSAMRNWGVRELLDRVHSLAGPRGNVWAVGSQNVGKSTLINAMAQWGPAAGDGARLTESPVPGTTLGVMKVDGVLEGRAKLYDTPGILNPSQITTRLNRDEQKLVQITKPLRPRTYRVKVGQSIHAGGLVRMDIEELTVGSLYVTVWASSLLPLHMGQTQHASSLFQNHFGLQLQPPIGKDRVKELGKWVRKEFKVCGNSWDSNCVDIAVSGLGWFGISLRGEAVLGLWTYEGVEVLSRSSLIHTRAAVFEEPGFSVSKIVSQADRASDKIKRVNKSGKKFDDGKAVKSSDAIVDA